MARFTWEQWERKLFGWTRNQQRNLQNELQDVSEEVKKRTATHHLSGPRMATGHTSTTAPTIDSKGAMRRMLATRVTVAQGRVQAEVVSRHGLSRVHHEGAVLFAPDKPFRFQIGGRWVVTRRIVIPPRPFLRAALMALSKNILRRIGKRFIDGYAEA